MPLPLLSLLETRILGVLVEKQHTVPDTYPLTLNALVAGCNQKTSREPVLDASEAEVQAALDRLRSLAFVMESSGGRVMRYAHNTGRVLGVPAQAVAILAVMMLRGPQTVAEVRIHSERIHRFADISSVEGFLDELAARAEGALVAELPRAPGARETRWTHLLSGMAAVPVGGRAASVERVAVITPGQLASEHPSAEPPGGMGMLAGGTAGELAILRTTVTRLENELASLRTAVDRIVTELGLPRV